uniref:Serpin domain-containing protein n=1 Tax=Graphocephala atropunctata TaxID=36148 RepID=A0A1B6LYT5_9HEMI
MLLVVLMVLMSLVVPLTAKCPVHVANVSDFGQSVLQQSRLQVAAELLHTVAVQQSLQNVLLSPFTIHSALLLLFFAASGNTEKLLRKLLHLPDTVSKDMVVGQYIQERNSSDSPYQLQEDGHEFYSVKGFYGENGLNIRQCMDTLFPNEYHTINLRQHGVAVHGIKLWIANETRNNIDLNLPWKTKQQLNFGVKSTALISAAYFRGVWFTPFPKNLTKKERFYTKSETFVEVDMMTTTGFFSLWSGGQIPMKILELPYKRRSVNMIILLPSKKPHDSVMLDFLHSFTNETFEKVLKLLSNKFPSTVQVRLPKIVTEKEYDLQQVLSHLGGDLLFGAGVRFQDLFDSRHSTVLKTVYHKVKMDVNEGESEEKDFTLNQTSSNNSSCELVTDKPIIRKKLKGIPKSTKKILFNQPFIYFIYHKTSKTVLFSGIFYSP